MVRRKKKSNIICVMRPIENIEVYKKSLATVMLDILEKQLGTDLFIRCMDEISKEKWKC